MKQARGFTLLEVLVALTLFALVGGALLQLFHGGLRSTRSAAEYTHAALLARSKLVEVQAFGELGPGVHSGEFAGGYRWQIELSELPDLQDETIVHMLPLALALRVEWGAGKDEKSLSLDSLLLSARKSP